MVRSEAGVEVGLIDRILCQKQKNVMEKKLKTKKPRHSSEVTVRLKLHSFDLLWNC